MSATNIHPAAPPVLSTPDTHIFEAATFIVDPVISGNLTHEELCERYETERTVREIRQGGWTRVALQFDDSMLPHAVRVYETLQQHLDKFESTATLEEAQNSESVTTRDTKTEILETAMKNVNIESTTASAKRSIRLFILADTSYGACCVDEVAAEHVDAEVVVHYGRTCLSPTTRLPVIYVFTTLPLVVNALMDVFEKTYSDKNQKIILMSDVPYSAHQTLISKKLIEMGYDNIFSTDIIHDPSSPLPNRTVPSEVIQYGIERLKSYSVFHIGQPPTALLLTLASRVSTIHIYDPSQTSSSSTTGLVPNRASTLILRRRYALVASLSTCSIFGILVNTLSVANYQHVVSHVAKQLTQAGKKSYTFVVGKVNAAKMANFAEIGGWVVVGCWESSLVESGGSAGDFYKPLITPFELELALKGEGRVWTGDWRSDFGGLLLSEDEGSQQVKEQKDSSVIAVGNDQQDWDDEEESEPPEFDLRSGRYVSHTRPMKVRSGRRSEGVQENRESSMGTLQATGAVIKRAKGELAQIGGTTSPGAQFLRENRTWQGLGSDFETDFTTQGAVMEEGRSGVAKGYTVGEDGDKT
jgi:diphthamide biosynthesis protein 2